MKFSDKWKVVGTSYLANWAPGRPTARKEAAIAIHCISPDLGLRLKQNPVPASANAGFGATFNVRCRHQRQLWLGLLSASSLRPYDGLNSALRLKQILLQARLVPDLAGTGPMMGTLCSTASYELPRHFCQRGNNVLTTCS